MSGEKSRQQQLETTTTTTTTTRGSVPPTIKRKRVVLWKFDGVIIEFNETIGKKS